MHDWDGFNLTRLSSGSIKQHTLIHGIQYFKAASQK